MRFVSVALLSLALIGQALGSVPQKWHTHFFTPRFRSALDDLKGNIQGSQDRLRGLLEHIEKNKYLKDLFKHKVDALFAFIADPTSVHYMCPSGWELLSKDNFNMCYLIVSTSATYEAARQDCLSQGGDLFQPIPGSAVDTFLRQDLLETTSECLWVGSTVDATKGLLLNGFNLVPQFPTGHTLTAASVACLSQISDGDSSISFEIKVLADAETHGYVCESMAMPIWYDLDLDQPDFKGTEFNLLFGDFKPNTVDVEDSTGVCSDPSHVIIWDYCYKYFPTKVTFNAAKAACVTDGGNLASPDLSTNSKFGSALAAILKDVAAKTKIWIHADVDDGGRDRVLPSVTPLPVPPKNGITTKKPPKDKSDEHDPLVIILPAHTPDDTSDDTTWSIKLITDAKSKCSYLCHYHPAQNKLKSRV